MTENLPELALDVDRMIDATPETVFRLLTEPDLYAQWFGPPGAEVSVEEMELTLGGRLLIHVAMGGARVASIEGFYEVISPPNLIVHTWRGVGEDLVTSVRFELEPQGAQTRLRIIHRGFVDPLELEQHHNGWSDLLGEIAVLAPTLS